ncbi:hypothetical protein E1200_28255, partial [Actinomadura sp. GC306]|uniref:hypothetical protein n=1 Tax=Actinomadura sp. GC306 TaxID=2530367 RepID=UPI001042D617
MKHSAANPLLSRRAFTLGGAALLGAAAAGPLAGTAHAAPPSGDWTDVPIPPLSGRAQLFGIAAPDPLHVIAGGTEDASGRSAVMLHRGLRGWTRAALPAGLAVVNDVRARHFADAWAVAAGPDASARTDLLHWNGRRWTTAAGPAGEQLYAIDLDRTGALWATGITPDGATVSVRRGGRWTNTLTLPGLPGLNAIAAGGPSDVWAGGFGGSSTGTTPLWHFDGAAWTRIPWGTAYAHWILQIEHVAHDDVWFYALEQHPLFPPPALHHWNGSEFTVHRIPGPSDPAGGVRPMSATGFLGSIASDGRGGVWVSTPADTSHLLHFDGSTWTRETPPATVTAYAMTRVPHTTTIWAGTQVGTLWRRSALP